MGEFATLDEVIAVLKAWRHGYSYCRPHGSLGYLTPSEYGSKSPENDSEASSSSFKWFEKRTNFNARKALDQIATESGGVGTKAYGIKGAHSFWVGQMDDRALGFFEYVKLWRQFS